MKKHSTAHACLTIGLCLSMPLLNLFVLTTAAKASNNITVGMSAALSGPSQDLGLQIKLGIETYFHHVNGMGGMRGRKFKLQARDDGYDPALAEKNMREFINNPSILAVIGNVGTPTAQVTVPLANEGKILLFGAYTGADVLRKTPNRYIINYRASYAQETERLVDHILGRGILPYEIALFIQQDGFGEAILNGTTKALADRGFKNTDLIKCGYYKRNTLDIEDAIITIVDAPVEPKAILMAGTYGPCANFVRIAKRRWPTAIFATVSFVGSSSLRQALAGQGEGVVITQVVPGLDADLKLIREYRDHLRAYAPGEPPTFISLEGYIVARLFTEGIKRAGKTISRESVIDGLLKIENLDIGIGKNISFNPPDHQGCHYVWPTQITQKGFQPLDSGRE